MSHATRTLAGVAAAVLAIALFVLPGCGDSTAAPGSDGGTTSTDPKELVFAFAKQKDPQKMQADADALAKLLGEELGIPVSAEVPLDYGATVQAMVSDKADVAYFDSLAYLLAKRDGGAEILLAEVRPDVNGTERTNYDSIFVVAADSPINSVDDLIAKASELRFTFTSPTSTSGYLMAVRRFVDEGLLKAGEDPSTKFAAVAFGGSYVQALEQVIDGRADACAVSFYTMEGPRADNYLTADQRAKLKIIGRTPAVPTHVVAVRGELSDDLKARIKAALLKISGDNADLLADVYGASKLTEVDGDAHVAATVEALKYVGQDVDEFVK